MMIRDERPVRMPDSDVRSLMGSEVDGYVSLAPRFVVGDRVVVDGKGHHLCGLVGLVQESSRTGRVRVLMMLLGRTAPCEVAESDLALAA